MTTPATKTVYPAAIGLLLLTLPVFFSCQSKDSRFLIYEADPMQVELRFYWKDDQGRLFGSLGKLRRSLEAQGKSLVFAMNGGMFKPDRSPQGLYIENGKTMASLDTAVGRGNFYLKPNGIFYVTTDGKAVICSTDKFVNDGSIQWATQSGPLLLMDGNLHPAFRKNSSNRQVRNGVGLMPDGRVVFAMSKQEVSFFDFAEYFRRMGCRQALYLDGFVSRTYLPEKKWLQEDGDFGLIIAVTTTP